MRFTLTLFLLLLIAHTHLHAQSNYELTWSNGENSQIMPYNADCVGYVNLECQKIRLDTQNDVVVSGISNEQGQWDVLVVKYDNSGNFLWKQLLNRSAGSRDLLRQIRIDQNDHIHLLMRSIMPDYSRSSSLLKLDADGGVIWEYEFPDEYTDAFSEDFVVDESGACYITGTLPGANSTSNMFVFKLTPEGSLAWEDSAGDEMYRTHGVSIKIINDEIVALGAYSLGGFEPFIIGLYAQIYAIEGGRMESHKTYFGPSIKSIFIGNQGDYYLGDANHFRIVKFNRQAEMEWEFSMPTNLPPSSYSGVLNHILDDEEGNVYVTGADKGGDSENTDRDLQVVKLSPEGEMLYEYRYQYFEGNTREEGNRLSLGPDNQLLIGGASQRIEGEETTYEYLAIVLDSSGVAVDTLRYSSETDAVVKSVAFDQDLNLYLTGTASGSTVTQKYSFSNATNSNELLQNQEISVFPNPCQDQFTFFFPNQGQPYALKLFAENGKLLFHRTHCSTKEQLVDTQGWPAGMYYYQLIAAEGLFSGKLIKQH